MSYLLDRLFGGSRNKVWCDWGSIEGRGRRWGLQQVGMVIKWRILSILTSEEMKHETRENSHTGVKTKANVTDINDDRKHRLDFPVAGPVAVTVAEPVAVTLAVPQIGPEAVPRNEPVAVPVQAAVPKAGQLSVPKAGPESHVQLADVGNYTIQLLSMKFSHEPWLVKTLYDTYLL
ncbi:hypothetical protein Btru_044452 [Bulinus truncatus]|nr:hypothetical protein Btru_044452 [Bulinus truncatus]